MAEARAIRSLAARWRSGLRRGPARAWRDRLGTTRGGRIADEAGFTLVEMLVSLALTALIAVLLIQALQATAIVTGSARRLSAQEGVQVVREHVRRTLAEAERRRGDGGRIPFIGQADRLVAVVAANRDAERDAELRVGLGTIERPGRAGLALVETRSAAAGPAEEPEALLDGILGLRLRYFGPFAQDTRPGWQPSWTRTDRLPTLIEVAVDFPAADPRRWPTLVVPLGAGP